MVAKKKNTGIEWVGGLISMPTYILNEGEPFRPEALFWISSNGLVFDHMLGRPGELLGLAAKQLKNILEQTINGKANSPDRVRVASPELAEALRAGHPGLEIVCAPTPELDAMLGTMHEKMSEDAESSQSYLSPEIVPDATGSFFRAAAGLFRAKPWKLVPDDQSLLSVSIEKLGVRDAVLSVIGQLGQKHGVLLFSNIGDFDDYLDAVDAIEQGDPAAFPPHFGLSFERASELTTALRKEILQHRWEVARADAYPLLIAVEQNLLARPISLKELTAAEAIALALPRLLTEKKALLAAWEGEKPVERTLTVSTHAGDIEVTFHVPPASEVMPFSPPYDVIAALFELGQEGEQMDEVLLMQLNDELERRFVASPEARGLSGCLMLPIVMDMIARVFHTTIATLRASELEQLVFESFPRQAFFPASVASLLIAECRALYTFLDREFGLKQANACLRVLAGDATKRLKNALSKAVSAQKKRPKAATSKKVPPKAATPKAPKKVPLKAPKKVPLKAPKKSS